MVSCDEPVPARELYYGQSCLMPHSVSFLLQNSGKWHSVGTYYSNDLFSNVHLNSPDCVYSLRILNIYREQ